MSQNFQIFVKFKKFQLENLVDFEKCCKTHVFLQKSEPIQPKTSNILPKFCQPTLTASVSWTGPAPCRRSALPDQWGTAPLQRARIPWWGILSGSQAWVKLESERNCQLENVNNSFSVESVRKLNCKRSSRFSEGEEWCRRNVCKRENNLANVFVEISENHNETWMLLRKDDSTLNVFSIEQQRYSLSVLRLERWHLVDIV